MNKNLFIKAEEIATELGVSKSYAYKLIRKLNEELKNRGFITISGKVNRQFFEEKIYGLRKEESYVSLQR
ncbi:MAG: HTH domain-containing protein [Firmicutes bacterium]|jgi:predicted transcriptional regulator|nr:HTH domain-containing protein [Bacillota bacterium]